MWRLLLSVLALVVARVAADEQPPLRCCHNRCRYLGMFEFDEHRYEVDGNELSVIFGSIDGFLRIKCVEGSISGSPAMPRADPALTAWHIVLVNCQLPVTSLAEKLDWLNVTMRFDETKDIETRSQLTIDRLPSHSLITANHFIGLERLLRLDIGLFDDDRVSAERNFLAPLQSLRLLRIQHLPLPAGELDAPRASLRDLTLLHAGVTQLPEAIYSSSSLHTLTIESDRALDAVSVPPRLESLNLRSAATTLQLDAAPTLETLRVLHWTKAHPLPLTRCDNLRHLSLTAPAMETLPEGWLANCSSLEEVIVTNAQSLTSLPSRLFGTSHSDLTHVAFKEGALESLSEGQFNDACEMFTLELNGNRLRTIPNATLPLSLRELDLSSNDLDGGVLPVVGEVQYGLSLLNLGSNPRLGDVCDEGGYSPLRPVTTLTRLLLNKTNVTRLCRDWRQGMPLLATLDLSDTSVSSLSFEDLQYWRTVPNAKVWLKGAPVTLLEMTSEDLEKAKRAPTSGATVKLGADACLECDCRMYWTRRVLERSPHSLEHVGEMRCEGGRPLRELRPEDMVCPRPGECAAAGLPAACACAVRPDEDAARGRRLVRVSCERGGLARVPRLPADEERVYELRLAHNRIADLNADDLRNVKGLDLRNNSIKAVDEATAAVLGVLPGTLRLAGNPLQCSCGAAPLLRALRGRPPARAELRAASCAAGAPLDAVLLDDCSPSIAGLAAAFAAALALAVSTIWFLASRERRFFLKAVLHRWGLWRGAADEDERKYDAFVTFSHRDEAPLRELVARLEPPYRLCLHHRDWIPGLRIPDQIVESVRDSHRTVALVSRHFLASSWARAEFREAHEAAMIDARPRLIVVLLEEPAALQIDERLRRYIATHTYLRWEEPWFYHKLAVALPRPRRPTSVLESAPFGPSLSTISGPKFDEKQPTSGAPVPLSAAALPPATRLCSAPRSPKMNTNTTLETTDV